MAAKLRGRGPAAMVAKEGAGKASSLPLGQKDYRAFRSMAASRPKAIASTPTTRRSLLTRYGHSATLRLWVSIHRESARPTSPRVRSPAARAEGGGETGDTAWPATPTGSCWRSFRRRLDNTYRSLRLHFRGRKPPIGSLPSGAPVSPVMLGRRHPAGKIFSNPDGLPCLPDASVRRRARSRGRSGRLPASPMEAVPRLSPG